MFGRFFNARLLTILAAAFGPLTLAAQLQVTPNNNATALVNQLIGPGITVSNATITGPALSSGTFNGTTSNIGLPGGVLLTSGDATNAIGPNISSGISTSYNAPGDAQLDLLSSPYLTEDACILEFDMVATCDTIQISYVFGSDEYDEWVCTSFTDVFAFFISGPGIVGTQNIAVIPNTTTPISINTVNIGTVGVNAFPPYPTNCNTGNSAFYTTNNIGNTVEYDGFTVPLIAKSAVIPCSTYHIKLAIADAGDDALDSGVFLEQGGIRCTSTQLSVTSSVNAPGYSNAIEGCMSGTFTFVRSGDTTVAQSIPYTVAGTATPGLDYPVLPGVVNFPPMVSTVTINVTAANDFIPEGTESVMVILTNTVCTSAQSDTAILYIADQLAINAGPSVTLCQGNSAQIGIPPQPGVTYSWLPSTSLSSSTNPNPTFQNTTPGTYVYTLTGTDTYGCSGGDSLTVTVNLSPTSTFSGPTQVCQGDVVTYTYTGNAGPNATYNWTFPGATILSGSGQGPYQVRWNSVINSNVSLQVSVGSCTSLITAQNVTVQSKPSVTLAVDNVNCAGGFDGSIMATVANATPPVTFLWSNSSTNQNLLNAPAGTYSVTVSSGIGCRDTATAVITQPTPLTHHLDSTSIICFGGTGTLTSVPGGGTPPYSYLWSNGPSTPTINPTTGLYAVTVTDANGCTIAESGYLDQPPMVQVDITGDSVGCTYETLTLNAAPLGGVPPYTYLWTTNNGDTLDSIASITFPSDIDRYVTLTIQDSLGCPGQTTIFTDAILAPYVDFTPSITEACDSATVLWINNSQPPGCTYQWEFTDGSTSNQFQPSIWFGNGFYGAKLTVTTPEGCVSSINRANQVYIVPTPVASFETHPNITLVDYLLLSEATVTFANTSPWYAHSVDWSFGNGDSAFVGQVDYTFLEPGQYNITMTAYNIFGCHDDTTQTLIILQDPGLWIPSGFTPNGDGLNDRFDISGVEVKDFHIDIFDRWGKLVFRSDDIHNSWTGDIGGDQAPEGVYVYKVNATVNTGKTRKQGSVTLIR